MESKENSLLRPARCGRWGEFFCFLVFGFGVLVVTAGSVGAVFILNGMIFSFLDERQVFKGVI